MSFELTISDCIELLGIIASLAIGIISLIIAVKTLRQNSKMIEEANRPYVLMSYEVVNTGAARTYFVLKNYGKTGARITAFSHNREITDKDLLYQFSNIVGTYLAPGQKKMYLFDAIGQSYDEIEFQIEYESTVNAYKEKQLVKIKLHAISTRNTSNDAESYALQEIAERLI